MSKQTDLLNLTDAITVDSSNNVGIGTSFPGEKLSIVGTGNGTSFSNTTASTAYNRATVVGNAGGSVKIGVDNNIGTAFSSGNYGGSIQSTNNLAFSAGGSERLRIDSSGRVTMPYQPGFNASSGSQQFITSAGVVIYANTSWASGFNSGSNYNTSNGRFTCPVGGIYLITLGFYKEVNTAGVDLDVRVNGGSRGEVRAFTSNGDHESFNGTFVWKLAANDFIDVYNEQPKVHLNNVKSQFSVVLLS